MENILDEDDRILLSLNRIQELCTMDWGRTISISNQFIQMNILRKFGYDVSASIEKNNNPGYDFICNGRRIQSKLRQVNGKAWFSRQIHFETTRRNSSKNYSRNSSGHICYGLDEFDFAFISIVHTKKSRNDINNWKFVLIPISHLYNQDKSGLITQIPSKTLIQFDISRYIQ